MFIAVKCVKCDWIGNAEVGGRMGGPSMSDQCCPRCHSDIKRRPGNRDLREKFAEYKE